GGWWLVAGGWWLVAGGWWLVALGHMGRKPGKAQPHLSGRSLACRAPAFFPTVSQALDLRRCHLRIT
ncbi:MAG: hypothetical protein ACOH2H_23815, partial [Cypionkella sp.]